MSAQVVAALRANRELATPEQVKAWDQAIAQFPVDPSFLRELHLVFTDATKNEEVMFGLVHVLEDYDMDVQLAAFVSALPEMLKDAREWVLTLTWRILNDAKSREAYKAVLKAADPGARDAARGILEEVARDEKPPLQTGAQEVLAAL